jgi:phage gp37-like protein
MTQPFNPIVNQAYAGAVTALLTGLRDYLRQALPQKDVKTVDFYGGEFDEAEIPKTEYACPAVFITCLGFGRNESPRQGGKYAKTARVAVFVATKHGTREGRFVECVDLVERISTLVTMWQPQTAPQSCVLQADGTSFVAENLYNRKLDAQKHALWLLSWSQGFEPVHGVDASTLPDLVSVHVDDTVLSTVPDPAPPVLNPLQLDSCLDINYPQP